MENDEPKLVKIRKVHLETMIDLLHSMWDSGVDYIDIIGTMGEENDTIGFSFCKAYMAEEYEKDFDKFGEPDEEGNTKVELSDEDLNNIS